MRPDLQLLEAVDVSPPIASSRTSPARKCRPPLSARSTWISTLSFAAASGRDSPENGTRAAHSGRSRPLTSRPGSSHRRLSTGTTTQWQFLTKTAAEDHPSAPVTPRQHPVRPRPATARSTTPGLQTSEPPLLPKRPATCRGERTAASSKKSTTAHSSNMLFDPRVIQEAARHEVEHEEYVDPLIGRSVEVQRGLMCPKDGKRVSSVTNAISIPEFHRIKASQARSKGDYAAVIAHYEDLLRVVPRDHVALFQLAVAYEKTGQLDAALVAYRKVLPTDHANPFLHYNLGNLLMKMDKIEEAIASYSAAIQKSGSGKCPHLAFYRQRGAAYRKHGDFEKAAQDYARLHIVRTRRHSLGGGERSALAPKEMNTEADDQADLRDETYSAEPLYSIRGDTGGSVDLLVSPLDSYNQRRAIEVASRLKSERTDEDIEFLVDELQRQFPLCAALDFGACKFLSERTVAVSSAHRGTVLFREGDRGSHLFLVSRGQVGIFKSASVQGHSETANNNADSLVSAAVDDKKNAISWETVRTTILDDPTYDAGEFDTAVRSVMATTPSIDLNEWSQTQLMLTSLNKGDAFGLHGRFSHDFRSYSAIVSESCDFFAISWNDFAEAENLHQARRSDQTTKFLATVPLFHGISLDELRHLSLRAKSSKVVGSRVICSEGQHVNGIVVVREGGLCQIQPSALARPPNLSVAFSLSGSISIHGHDLEHSGLHFFVQLEYADDPLCFLHDSRVMHGFLPQEYLPRMLEKLSQPRLEAMIRNQSEIESADHQTAETARPDAVSLPRGAFFCASSAWVPPRKSRGDSLHAVGVACAKSALITTESSELLFFTAADIIQALSLPTRALLQKNMQELVARRSARQPVMVSTSHPPLPESKQSNLHRLVFLKPPPGDDLIEQFLHEAKWQRYKKELVNAIVDNSEQTKPRSVLHRSTKGQPIRTKWRR